MSIIRGIVIEHVRTKQEESNQAWEDTHHYDEPRLFVSDIGHCPRVAYYNAFGHFDGHPFCVEKTHPFDDYVVEILRAGTVWEHQTGLALRHVLDGAVHWRKDDPALEVQNDIWLGHMDFLVEPCDQLPGGAIIEHKATNPVNFQRKDRLPYPFHYMQVLMYRRLLQQKLRHGSS